MKFVVVSFVSGSRGNQLTYGLYKKFPNEYSIVNDFGGKTETNWHNFDAYYKDIFFNQYTPLSQYGDAEFNDLPRILRNHQDTPKLSDQKYNLIVTHNYSDGDISRLKQLFNRTFLNSTVIVVRILLNTLDDKLDALKNWYNNISATGFPITHPFTIKNILNVYYGMESDYPSIPLVNTISVNYGDFDFDSLHNRVINYKNTVLNLDDTDDIIQQAEEIIRNMLDK